MTQKACPTPIPNPIATPGAKRADEAPLTAIERQAREIISRHKPERGPDMKLGAVIAAVEEALETVFVARAQSDCPSCGGLNISCPDGCGRDAETGELDGSALATRPDSAASGTEAGTAETVQQGSAEGEGLTANGGDAQGQSA